MSLMLCFRRTDGEDGEAGIPHLSEPRRKEDDGEDLYMKVPENVDGINDYDENGYTPLHSAIVSGKVYTSIMSDALNDN